LGRRKRAHPDRSSRVARAPEKPRASWRWPLAIFVAALLIRLAYLADIADHPLFRYPVVDAALHVQWADDIREGKGAQHIPFYKPPLYPYALAAIRSIAGEGAVVPALLQVLLSSTACVLIYLLARAAFGLRVAAIAGLGAALLDTSVFFDAQLLAVSPLVLLSLTMLYLAHLAESGNRLWLWGAAGVAAGLCGLLWAPTLVAVPGTGLWAWFRMRSRGRYRGALSVGLLLLGTALPIVPVTAANWVASGDRVLISSNGGINFYIGNGPGADGHSAVPVGVAWEELQRREEAQDVAGSRASAFWVSETLGHIRAHPAWWVRLMGRRAVLFWQGFEPPNNISIDSMRGFSLVLTLLPVRFGLVAPLALWGIWCARRSRSPLSGLLLAFIGSQFLAIIAFFVCDRYRMGVVFPLMVFAALGADRLVAEFQARRWPRAIPSLVAALALLVAANADFLRVRSECSPALDLINLGNACLGLKQPSQALEAFRAAARVDPANADAHLLTAALLRDTGQAEAARDEYEAAVRLAPDSVHARVGLGETYLRSGRLREAVAQLREAVGLRPRDAGARTWLAMAYRADGRHVEAAGQFEAILAKAPEDALAHTNLARVLLEAERDTPRALEAAKRAVALDPGSVPALDTLGWALLRSGQAEAAIPHLRRALEMDAGPDAMLHLAEALAATGDAPVAEEAFRAVVERWPDSPHAARARARLGALPATVRDR